MSFTPTIRASLVSAVICTVLAATACVFDKHISTAGIPQLERIASYLDLAESPATTTGLQSVCSELEVWAADSGRDGDIVTDICERAFAHHDWPGARKMMLDAFPFRERQAHLDQ